MIVDDFYSEIQKMGGNILVDQGTATIKPSQLHGAAVYASDLRAGACLMVAGLIAEGVTTIYNVNHIYRGYTNIVENLKSLGADIWSEKLCCYISLEKPTNYGQS